MKNTSNKKVLTEMWFKLVKELLKSDEELKLDSNNLQNKSDLDYSVGWSFIDSLTRYFNEVLKYTEIKDLYDDWKDIDTKNRIETFKNEWAMEYHRPFEELNDGFVYDHMINIHLPKSKSIARIEYRILIADFINAINLKFNEKYDKKITFDKYNGEVFFKKKLIGSIRPNTRAYDLFNILFKSFGIRVEFTEIAEKMGIKNKTKSYLQEYVNGIKRELPENIKKYIKSDINAYILSDKSQNKVKK